MNRWLTFAAFAGGAYLAWRATRPKDSPPIPLGDDRPIVPEDHPSTMAVHASPLSIDWKFFGGNSVAVVVENFSDVARTVEVAARVVPINSFGADAFADGSRNLLVGARTSQRVTIPLSGSVGWGLLGREERYDVSAFVDGRLSTNLVLRG